MDHKRFNEAMRKSHLEWAQQKEVMIHQALRVGFPLNRLILKEQLGSIEEPEKLFAWLMIVDENGNHHPLPRGCFPANR